MAGPNNKVFVAIHPQSGMCNRLRAIFSFYLLSIQRKQKFLVVWEECRRTCPGILFEYYLPIPGTEYLLWKKDEQQMYNGIELVKRGSKRQKEVGKFTMFTSGGEFGCGNKKEYCGKYTNLYKYLTLNEKTQSIIDEAKTELGDYVAVHIRRTDHKKNKQEINQVYINFINSFPKSLNVYIATDCIKTKKVLYETFKDRIRVIQFNHIIKSRQTSMLDAIIDVHMCIESNHFYGTNGSSFSELIYQKRYFEKKMDESEYLTAKKKKAILLDCFPVTSDAV